MTPHACDETCVCPFHQTPLIYAPSIDDHACQDIECTFGHGMKPQLIGLAAMVAAMPDEDFEQIPERATPHPRDPEVWSEIVVLYNGVEMSMNDHRFGIIPQKPGV